MCFKKCYTPILDLLPLQNTPDLNTDKVQPGMKRDRLHFKNKEQYQSHATAFEIVVGIHSLPCPLYYRP